MEKLEKKVSLVILVVVVVAALFLSLIGFISDFMWFKEMGYVAVFFTQLLTQLKVGIPTFIIVIGYTQQDIAVAMKGVDVENLPLEEIVRQSLKKMVK